MSHEAYDTFAATVQNEMQRLDYEEQHESPGGF